MSFADATPRVGESGYQRQRLYLEAAGLAKTPYKVEYVTFDSGVLQLQTMAAGSLDLAQSSSGGSPCRVRAHPHPSGRLSGTC